MGRARGSRKRRPECDPARAARHCAARMPSCSIACTASFPSESQCLRNVATDSPTRVRRCSQIYSYCADLSRSTQISASCSLPSPVVGPVGPAVGCCRRLSATAPQALTAELLDFDRPSPVGELSPASEGGEFALEERSDVGIGPPLSRSTVMRSRSATGAAASGALIDVKDLAQSCR